MKRYILFLSFLFKIIFIHAQWITLTPLPTIRQEMPSVVLNGKIYTTGGISQLAATLKTVEIYDPATNTWSAGTDMPVTRHHHAMCTLNGKIYVIGGYADITFQATNNVYMFDPANSTWVTKASLPFISGAGDAVSYNGKIYFIGGTNGTNALDVCLEYNPQNDSWTQKNNMPTSREHLCVALVDTLIYAIAGRGGSGTDIAVEVYNPTTDTWTGAPNLPTGRSGCDAAVVDGKIFVLGGEGSGIYNQNEMYNPLNQTWYTLDSMPHARHGLGVIAIGDTIYAVGGATTPGFGPSNLNEAFIASNVPTSVSDFINENNIAIMCRYDNSSHELFAQISSAEIMKAGFSIAGVDGMVISAEEISLNEGLNYFSFKETKLSAGIYFAVIRNRNKISSKQFILFE